MHYLMRWIWDVMFLICVMQLGFVPIHMLLDGFYVLGVFLSCTSFSMFGRQARQEAACQNVMFLSLCFRNHWSGSHSKMSYGLLS